MNRASCRRAAIVPVALAAVTLLVADPAAGRETAGVQTLEGSLGQAYRTNPTLNALRAQVRATDESVAIALGGFRPQVAASATTGIQRTETDSIIQGRTAEVRGTTNARSLGVTASQTLFNGFQTGNRVRAAEAQVLTIREQLRSTEQAVLLDAATQYMNVLRDRAIVDLNRRNVEVLEEQLRATRDRFNVGEVTRTDVAQAESRLAGAQSQLLVAQATLNTSRAAFRRAIGSEAGRLAAGRPIDRLLPPNLNNAVDFGVNRHPDVRAALYQVDVAQWNVKVAEGALYPTLRLEANVNRAWDQTPTVLDSYTASILGRVTMPIYQGGSEFATIRQAKETLAQNRINVDTARDRIRAQIIQTWGQLEAARATIESSQAQITAAEIALNGVREEARVGQRTTLDVLNAQQELLNARVNLVVAQRDRVVASYAVVAAIGRLVGDAVGLEPLYDPAVHYGQVRDLWVGVRTPDGR